MMSMTHIAVGISTALIMTNPQEIQDFIPPIIGGAIGGIISDVDIRSNSYCRDALYGRLVVIGIVITSLAMDWFYDWGIIRSLLLPNRRFFVCAGIIAFIILLIIGMFQKHRGFTHSLLCGLLTTISVCGISPAIGLCFIMGFLSHLILDSLNKRPIRLFFPAKKGICFKLCYANKTANKVFLVIGILILVFYAIRLFFTL